MVRRWHFTAKHGELGAYFVAILALIVFSVVLGVAGIYSVATGEVVTETLLDEIHHLSPNMEYRQGIGNFPGNGTIGDGTIPEYLTLKVENIDVFVRNFSVISYGVTHFSSTEPKITQNLTTGADYYEAVFWTDSHNSGSVHFVVSITKPQVIYPLAWLALPAKILFLAGIGGVVVLLIKAGSSTPLKSPARLEGFGKRLLVALLAVSLVLWMAFTMLNANPLGTFENWYTDHARDTYVAGLFLKQGLAVFSEPLGALACRDVSSFGFVTWPEMPNLYPVGSVAVFLPFAGLLGAGLDTVLVYKLEIALFLVLAHVCLYVFLSRYWSQTTLPRVSLQHAKENIAVLRRGGWVEKKSLLQDYIILALKIVGVYVMYASLVPFAANGMFDSVAVLFLLLAVGAFLVGRYDFFALMVGVSVVFKYQTAIFLFPLIVVAGVQLLKKHRLAGLVRNRVIVLAVVCAAISGFTAVLSAPYLMGTRSVLVMNAVNAFLAHAQIPWSWQAGAVLSVLAATALYSIYMYRRNLLLSLSALFLLVPVCLLPYFQNWYLPFLFAYMLIPHEKAQFSATMLWLVFVAFMLSFGGSGLNPQVLVEHFQTMIKNSLLSLGLSG